MHSTETKRKFKDESYKNKKVTEFNVQCSGNHYANFQNAHLCFPIKIKWVADEDNNITAGTVQVNKSFAHWIKEIDIKRYGNGMPILPLANNVNIYRYSNKLLKHITKGALKKLQNDLLYSKHKFAIYGDNNDRCVYYTTTDARAGNRTDENLTDRRAKFQNQIKNKYVYRIPLRWICDVGLVNQCFKFNTKYILTLEIHMHKLFETNEKQRTNALPTRLLMLASS